MDNLKSYWSGVGSQLGCSLFIGIILISVAAGSIFHSMNWAVAGRLVCRGKMPPPQVDTYSYRPGEMDITTTYYCIDQATGAKKDVTFLTVLVAGLIYSAILFMLLSAYSLVGYIRSAIGGGKTKRAVRSSN